MLRLVGLLIFCFSFFATPGHAELDPDKVVRLLSEADNSAAVAGSIEQVFRAARLNYPRDVSNLKELVKNFDLGQWARINRHGGVVRELVGIVGLSVAAESLKGFVDRSLQQPDPSPEEREVLALLSEIVVQMTLSTAEPTPHRIRAVMTGAFSLGVGSLMAGSLAHYPWPVILGALSGGAVLGGLGGAFTEWLYRDEARVMATINLTAVLRQAALIKSRIPDNLLERILKLKLPQDCQEFIRMMGEQKQVGVDEFLIARSYSPISDR